MHLVREWPCPSREYSVRGCGDAELASECGSGVRRARASHCGVTVPGRHTVASHCGVSRECGVREEHGAEKRECSAGRDVVRGRGVKMRRRGNVESQVSERFWAGNPS